MYYKKLFNLLFSYKRNFYVFVLSTFEFLFYFSIKSLMALPQNMSLFPFTSLFLVNVLFKVVYNLKFTFLTQYHFNHMVFIVWNFCGLLLLLLIILWSKTLLMLLILVHQFVHILKYFLLLFLHFVHSPMK